MAIALLFVAVLVNYVDRTNPHIAAVPMMKDFGISPATMGHSAVGIFLDLFAYADSGRISRRPVRSEVGLCCAFTLWSLASASVGGARVFPGRFDPASRSGLR